MVNSTNKPNTGFWIIGIAALIWNLMGVMAYIGQAYMTDEMLEALPEDQQVLLENVPIWATAAFAFAVFGGTLGSLLLLLRKKAAIRIFILSLFGILIQMLYDLFISDSMEVYGPGSIIMPIMVIIIGFFLIWYSKNSTEKKWLS